MDEKLDLIIKELSSMKVEMEDNHIQTCTLIKKMFIETSENKQKRIKKLDDDIFENMTNVEMNNYNNLNDKEKEEMLVEKRMEKVLLHEEEKKKEREEKRKQERENSSVTSSTKTVTNVTNKTTPVIKKTSTWTGYKKNNFKKLFNTLL